MGLFSSHSNLLRDVHHCLTTPEESAPRPEPAFKASRALRQITAAITQEIIDGYQQGLTVYELAARHACHRTTVSEVLKRNGIILRRTPATTEQVQEMIRLYKSGLSLARVGERFGMHASTVLKYLRLHDVKTRSPQG